MAIIRKYPRHERELPGTQVSLVVGRRLSCDHAMTRLLPSSAVRFAFVAGVLIATSLQAQASQVPTARVARDPVVLSVTPHRPQLGSLVLLSFRRSNSP